MQSVWPNLHLVHVLRHALLPMQDPWESISLGRELLSGADCVTEFVPLAGIGHCPQDEAPDVVNPLIARFVSACVKTPSMPVAVPVVAE